MKLVTWNGFWSIRDVTTHSQYMFIFGDNEQRIGNGGQAIIRYCPNAYGIPTKSSPYVYWSDDNLESNIKAIRYAIGIIKRDLNKFTCVVIAKEGYGTGLARLREKAPKTFAYLQKMLEDLYLYIIQK